MFGWLSRCWGGIGINTQFERARIRSVITDWKVPEDQDICVLINSFKGENPQIDRRTALDMFLSHMETDQERNDPIFLLKHLYILDQTVEERAALDNIAAYYSSQFFTFKTGSNIEITPIRELIATYFTYIKKKADIYTQIDPAYFDQKIDRKSVVENCPSLDIFGLVDKCLQVQKQINQINSKFKGRNKSNDLIRIIFTMLLKTYLFCYTMVSTCARVLFKRITKLTKPEAVRMYKFVLFFNKDYTRNFVDFIQSNKEIEIYKSIKYSQLILIEKTYIQYLQGHIRNIQNQPAALFGPESINVQQENMVQPLPEYIMAMIVDDIKIAYQPRKTHLVEGMKADPVLEQEYSQYKNMYTDLYESQYQTSLRYNYNMEQDKNRLDKWVGSESKLLKMKKVEYENSSTSTKFSQSQWNQWNNIYSS